MDDSKNMRPLFRVGDKVRINTERLSKRIVDDVNDVYEEYGCSMDNVFVIYHAYPSYCELSYNGRKLPYSYNSSILELVENYPARDSDELMDFLRGGDE